MEWLKRNIMPFILAGVGMFVVWLFVVLVNG